MMTLRLAVLALAAGVSALTVAPAAEAMIDLDGHFVGSAEIVFSTGGEVSSSCQIDVTQTAGSLSFLGFCGSLGFSGKGNIDAQTGMFTSTMSIANWCSAITVTGHADPTGYSFSGEGNGCAFSGDFGFSRCGNGVLDPGEDTACENAVALGMSALCCTPRCGFEPAGTVCYGPLPTPDAGCSLEMCTGSDAACETVPRPDGIPCASGACMTEGRCSQGECRGSPVADGTPCDLGGCTADTCLGGQCVSGSSPRCPAGSECCQGPASGAICCSSGFICGVEHYFTPTCFPDPRSSTSTTLPSGTSACDALGSFDAARCLIGRTLAAPLCAGEVPTRLDESLRAKLESALALLERATSIEGTRLARVLKRIRFKLERARIQTLRATNTERPVRRLSATCAATIQRLIADEEQRIANP